MASSSEQANDASTLSLSRRTKGGNQMNLLSKLGLAGAAALAATALGAGGASAQGNLTVYCGVQEEWCQAMVNAFQKETGISVSMTRKSAGEVYAQVAAEKANPKGDIWWGGTGDPHLQAAEEGLTLEYESPMLKDLQPWAIDQYNNGKKRTVGIYLGALGFGYNSDLLKQKNLPEPKCWADLIKPEYKGEIQIANPNSSGTAYNFLATLVQIMGEDKAFDFMKAMNANVNQYTKSGAAPIQAAARGETTIGVVFQHDVIATQLATGAPLVTVSPCEGTGYEIGSQSIIKGAANLDNAKKWYDWALTVDAQKLAASAGNSYQVPSNKGAPTPEHAPKMSDIKLINYDFAKFGSAAERKRLLARWDAEIGAAK
jgi:iron(III) transport system substrate-binding protein